MRRFLSLLVNLFIAAAVFTVWTHTLFRFSESGYPVGLAKGALSWLKYFTVLSNLLMGLASLAYTLALLLRLCGVTRRVAAPVRLLKYMATAALLLTLATVLAWIGPMTRFRTAFAGDNLWFHLIIPLAAALDFCLLDREGALAFPQTLLALTPPALYGAAYAVNLIAHGRGKNFANDWYHFTAMGWSALPLVFGALLIAAWLLAALLWLPRRRRRPR